MKTQIALLQSRLRLGLCLAAFLPLPSQAGFEVPYWLRPEWIAAKVMDLQTRNTENNDKAKQVAQVKNNLNDSVSSSPNAVKTPATTNTDLDKRKTYPAPVENANLIVNEKYLSKEELIELRKQLRQK